MATSLLALIDDIAAVLDDVAVISKVAAKKTAGVLGDDLALNAEQVSGVRAEREIPVVWAVAKGSFLNKLILVPSALLISAIYPPLITLLLILGGLYLCFEGFEKVSHKLIHRETDQGEQQALSEALLDPETDLVAFEQQKIKGAIRTDFILSAEIIVIILGTAKDQTFMSQVLTLSLLSVAFTVGVYGFVAGIVKLDDLGLYLLKKGRSAANSLLATMGKGLLLFAPFLMKTLSVVGTAAMFLVGGGILIHDIPLIHHVTDAVAQWVSGIHVIVDTVIPVLNTLVVGAIAGAMMMPVAMLISALAQRQRDGKS